MIEAPNVDHLPEAPGKVTCALLSVFDKTGLVKLASELSQQGVKLLSSGGTAKAIAEAGIDVITVETFTGTDEVLGGRVKTLHPKIHGGILADRRLEAHLSELAQYNYEAIDMVVCNLYPFEAAMREESSRSVMIENIDIGGPTLVRAAAKNADGGVTVVTDPSDYESILNSIRTDGTIHTSQRRQLAAKAFQSIANYDTLIAQWTTAQLSNKPTPLAKTLPSFRKGPTLRYGENPHQQAALYLGAEIGQGVANGRVLTGKALSYNNYLDMDAAYRAAYGLTDKSCAIVKHTNPCGLAQAATQRQAFERALAGDPISAFGSIIGLNSPLERATAEAIVEAKLFVECIAAPGFEVDARELLTKKKNLRLFEVPTNSPHPTSHLHRIGGGVLVQETDTGMQDPNGWTCVTTREPEPGWRKELTFAMHAAATLKSNAIAITHNRTLLGAGAGQMSRLDACEQAIKKAGKSTGGAFLGSDAFFPFDDCVRLAHEAGIVAVVQPGGSKRDQEVIDACDELGMVMLMTKRRHFKH